MRPGATSTSGGRSTAHRSWAIGQRVWKAHPLGRWTGSGTSPCGTIRSRAVVVSSPTPSSTSGTAESRAAVQGWAGAS